MAALLLSSDAPFLTGAALVVDGGYTAGRDHGVTEMMGLQAGRLTRRERWRSRPRPGDDPLGVDLDHPTLPAEPALPAQQGALLRGRTRCAVLATTTLTGTPVHVEERPGPGGQGATPSSLEPATRQGHRAGKGHDRRLATGRAVVAEVGPASPPDQAP